MNEKDSKIFNAYRNYGVLMHITEEKLISIDLSYIEIEYYEENEKEKYVNYFIESSGLYKILANIFSNENYCINMIPNNLKILKFSKYFNENIILPDELICLKTGQYFNKKIILPKNLSCLEFGSNFNKEIELPNKLKFLKFGNNFSKKINYPDSIEYLEFGGIFNKKVILPKNIKILIFGKCYNKITHLPEGIKKVIFSFNFRNKYNIPKSLEYLHIGCCYNNSLEPYKYLREIKTLCYFDYNGRKLIDITKKNKKSKKNKYDCKNQSNVFNFKDLTNKVKNVEVYVYKRKSKYNIENYLLNSIENITITSKEIKKILNLNKNLKFFQVLYPLIDYDYYTMSFFVKKNPY